TEQDTERARQAEQSSAGMSTQHLGMPAATAYAPSPNTAQPNLLGLALIGLGVLLVLGQIFTQQLNIVPGMILLTISSVFFFFGLWQRIYGLIIPASILGGLSAGVTFVGLTGGVSVLWGLALGFVTIYLLG